jgi:hypothetical protein
MTDKILASRAYTQEQFVDLDRDEKREILRELAEHLLLRGFDPSQYVLRIQANADREMELQAIELDPETMVLVYDNRGFV